MSDLIGQTLGQYRIETLLGSGGMGEVYRGVHVFLNRAAAVKVLRANLANDSDFQARFRQEAQSAAALGHPNIIEIWDFGEQAGQFYLVMELLTDGSLRTLLQQRAAGQPWPQSEGIDLVRQAADGLGYAHAKGMVHRDIKPDNLLLKRRTPGSVLGASPFEVKISDFGLARLVEGGGLKTQTGIVMGTPAYMSPEQCQGQTLDGRSDLYALGVVLYEVATGYLPFQSKQLSDAVYKHVHVAPTPPRQVSPEVSPALEAIILRLLAKNPAERFATGGDLSAALQSVSPGAAPPPRPVIFGAGSAAPFPQDLTVPSGGAMMTAPQVAVGVATPTPAIAPASVPPTGPRIRVIGQAGETLQTVILPRGVLTVGRQDGSGVVLANSGVSRSHMQIEWDGAHATVTDLGSNNGVALRGVRLPANAPHAWPAGEALHIGPYWLLLEAPQVAAPTSLLTGGYSSGANTAPPPLPQGLSNPGATPFPLYQSSARIQVKMEQGDLQVTPGTPAVVRVTLANKGTTVDHFTLMVEGVPPDWITNPGQGIQLNPGAQEVVPINLTVARLPRNLAGPYNVVIRARSRENPNEFGVAQVKWTVLPFTTDSLRMRPVRASGWLQARYALTVRNDGNALGNYALSGEDDEDTLRYSFAQERLGVAPGAASTIGLRVRGRLHLLGTSIQRNFTIRSQAVGTPQPQTLAGQFVNKALLPSWAPIAIISAVALLAIFVGVLYAAGVPGLPFEAAAPTATVAPTVAATAAPSATPKAATQFNIVAHEGPARTITPGNTLSTDAGCDASQQETLMSGGYSIDQSPTRTNAIAASYPSSGSTWTAQAYNPPGAAGPLTLHVLAYCLKANFDSGLKVVSAPNATAQQNNRASSRANCPGGSVLLGGGFKLTTPQNGRITKSGLPDDGSSGAWIAAAFGVNGSIGVQAYALCATKSLTAAHSATDKIAVDSGMEKDGSVGCPPGQLMTGGGFGEPFANGNPDLGADKALLYYLNGPPAGDTTWKVALSNTDGGGSHTANIWAICAGTPK